VAVLLTGVLASPALAAPARAGTIPPTPDPLAPLERAMLTLLDAERVAAGLPRLVPDLTLVAAARMHSTEMRDAGRVFHTPNLASIAQAIPGWRSLSENVGVGWSIESLHGTFMQSRSHRTAILGRYDRVGVGVVAAPGRIWVTQDFMRTR
jgi:uncharacterized protein YkwD